MSTMYPQSNDGNYRRACIVVMLVTDRDYSPQTLYSMHHDQMKVVKWTKDEHNVPTVYISCHTIINLLNT